MLASSLRALALLGMGLVGRSLAAAPGNVGACYSPFHSQAYPLHGERLASTDGVRAAIDADLKKLAGHFTHVRTYYAQYVGIDIAPLAAANGLKLNMGVFLTNEPWGKNEVDAAVRAVQEHPETVEAIIIGSENLVDFKENADTILNKVKEIKARLGPELAAKVKFGTAQRVNEYLDERFNGETAKLAAGLDFFGVNIYPFFTNSYDPANPEKLLDLMWKNVKAKYPNMDLRVTETGFPTAGSNPSSAPNVKPSLENAVGYYEGLLNWAPPGAKGSTKFWFQAFDLRADDKSMGVDYETHFGFFTADGQSKKANFPYPKDTNNFQPKPNTLAEPAAPVATPAATSAPAAPGAPTAPGPPTAPGAPVVPGAPSSAPASDSPTVTPAPTSAPKKSVSFDDIGNDGDVPGKITPKTETPTPIPTPKKKKASKKDCHG